MHDDSAECAPASAGSCGLLLINVGTPEAPTKAAVRRYLRQFLSDPRIIDLPAPARWALVDLLIAPLRAGRSAAAYARIWTEEGSPLLFHGRALQEKVRRRLAEEVVVVELAMRYGQPSIERALERFSRAAVDRIVAFPLYPQQSAATTQSAVEEVKKIAAAHWSAPRLQVVPPFYSHRAYIGAQVDLLAPLVAGASPERVVFSYHSLPVRQIKKRDPSGRCLARPDCCEPITDANRDCYRAQCFATTSLLGEALALPPERRVTSFQSRIGRLAWIGPSTDETLDRLAREGVESALIVAGSFVADCLETLEELKIGAVERWSAAGGGQLVVAPCLNADDAWADAVVAIARESAEW